MPPSRRTPWTIRRRPSRLTTAFAREQPVVAARRGSRLPRRRARTGKARDAAHVGQRAEPTLRPGRRATAPPRCIPLHRSRQRERPERQLLQADDVRRVVGDQLHHLAQERAALRRIGVAVEEIPRSTSIGRRSLRSRCGSSWQTRRRSRRRTTTSSQPPWPARAQTSRSSRRASASATLPRRTATVRRERVLPTFVAALPALAPAAAAEGGRASARPRGAARCARRRSARAVARPRSSTGISSGRTLPSVFTAHDLLPRRTAAQGGDCGPT